MHPDLERLIALQKIDSTMSDAERTLADEPSRLRALDVRLDDARSAVATAKQQVSDNHAIRREIDKDVALHQGRLSKFKEQSMAVKTNQEYHAVLHEIAFAQAEIKKHEDRMLEHMLEADELAARLKEAERGLTTAEKEVDAEKRAIADQHDRLRRQIDELRNERTALVSRITPDAMSVFDLVSRRRNGVAMAEAKDGICTICHVRLRPQVFNTLRRNELVLQCDSCQRILYFVAPPVPLTTESTS